MWKRERAPRETERIDRLTPEEQTNVKAAMRVLQVRHGTMRAVARLMGISTRTVVWTSPAMAAGVSATLWNTDDLLNATIGAAP